MAQQGKFNTEIPRFSGDQEERWRQLENYLFRLEENLRFAFSQLESSDRDNDNKEE